MWTAAIAEADKQTTPRGEALFPQGPPFRRALRHGVCPGSGTGTWRALMQKLPLLHGHNTRERTESSLQFKPALAVPQRGAPPGWVSGGHLWARVLRHASAARGRVSFPSAPRLVLTGARAGEALCFPSADPGISAHGRFAGPRRFSSHPPGVRVRGAAPQLLHQGHGFLIRPAEHSPVCPTFTEYAIIRRNTHGSGGQRFPRRMLDAGPSGRRRAAPSAPATDHIA